MQNACQVSLFDSRRRIPDQLPRFLRLTHYLEAGEAGQNVTIVQRDTTLWQNSSLFRQKGLAPCL